MVMKWGATKLGAAVVVVGASLVVGWLARGLGSSADSQSLGVGRDRSTFAQPDLERSNAGGVEPALGTTRAIRGGEERVSGLLRRALEEPERLNARLSVVDVGPWVPEVAGAAPTGWRVVAEAQRVMRYQIGNATVQVPVYHLVPEEGSTYFLEPGYGESWNFAATVGEGVRVADDVASVLEAIVQGMRPLVGSGQEFDWVEAGWGLAEFEPVDGATDVPSDWGPPLDADWSGDPVDGVVEVSLPEL